MLVSRQPHAVDVDGGTPILWALRDTLADAIARLTGKPRRDMPFKLA